MSRRGPVRKWWSGADWPARPFRKATGCVLVRGESGAGKELVARANQRAGSRADRPMLSVNCAAIPRDLMDVADLWPGEKVLVASITTGARLETYVLEGKPGTGKILINGGAAHLIREGERVTIMAFAITDTPPDAKSFLLDDHNQVVREAN